MVDEALAFRSTNKKVNEAFDVYETRVENALQSYGLNKSEFNSISVKLNKETQLRNKVILQAYFYKYVLPHLLMIISVHYTI